MTSRALPAISYTLLGAEGEQLLAYAEDREYYAASTVKLAVAAALLREADRGQLALTDTVVCTNPFPSRIPAAPDLSVGPEEQDPGMPAAGASRTLDWCLDRMLVVSSNEATNLLTNVLGLNAVNAAAAWLGAAEVTMTRLICDYAASSEGFTHTATSRGLAALMWQLCCGAQLSASARTQLASRLRTQRFPIGAEGLPEQTSWGSKSGWDDGIRHDVAFLGTPGTEDFRVLAICTEGFTPRGAQEAIVQLTRALHPALRAAATRAT
mgnify:FL=1